VMRERRVSLLWLLNCPAVEALERRMIERPATMQRQQTKSAHGLGLSRQD
jgi:hypothetical protein